MFTNSRSTVFAERWMGVSTWFCRAVSESISALKALRISDRRTAVSIPL